MSENTERSLPEVGTRVFIFSHADENSVNFYGYGTYKGEIDDPMFAENMPEALRDVMVAAGVDFKTPVLLRDDGVKFLGSMCYWGPATDGQPDAWINERELIEQPVEAEILGVQDAIVIPE